MAAKGSSFLEEYRNFLGFAAILTSAACEWFLIFLLLIDASLSYVLTKFARYCKLQAPCILCSRLDHVFGDEKLDNYQSLLCRSHRTKISSLASCHLHDRLADGETMCDDCLGLFATKDNSRAVRLDYCGNGFPSPSLMKGFTGMRVCSCCNKSWTSRQNGQRFQLKSAGCDVLRPTNPVPSLPGHSNSYSKDKPNNKRGRLGGSLQPHLGETTLKLLSHAKDPEGNITSGSESESLPSDDDDDDDDLKLLSHAKDPEGKITSGSESESLPSDDDDDDDDVDVIGSYEKESKDEPEFHNQQKSWPSNWDRTKQSNHSSDFRPSILDLRKLPGATDQRQAKYFASDAAIQRGLGEILLQRVHRKVDPSMLPELISFSDVSTVANVSALCNTESTVESKSIALPLDLDYSHQSEYFARDDAPPSAGTSPEKSEEGGMFNRGHTSVNKLEDTAMLRGSTNGECLNSEDKLDQSRLCKSTVSFSEGETSVVSGEQINARETDEATSDLKPLSSQNFYVENINLLPNCNNTSVDGIAMRLETEVASSSKAIQGLQKSTSVESCLESLDGSNVGEIEGESIVDRLKRQISYDRNRIRSLYKELEEERHAAEIAASQAMAMMTRLQEEKSALHMEALQYLRMMEEQAEYDMDALEKANDLLAEKEKEIQDLEAELEFYRSDSHDDTLVNIDKERRDMKAESTLQEYMGASHRKEDVNISSDSMMQKVPKASNKPPVIGTSSSEVEDEMSYIRRCLQCLEAKLYQRSLDRELTSTLNGVQTDVIAADETRTTEEGSASSASNGRFVGEETGSISNCQTHTLQQRESCLEGLESEISDLNDRLEALEADHDFLEHTLNSLQDGSKEGLQFVQEIAYQLRELRKIGLGMKCYSYS